MKYGHLEILNITLRALAPVFIGSGSQLNKKEYIFDPHKGIVYFPDFPRLVAFLKSRSLLREYQEYQLQTRNNDFRIFLEQNKVTESDYPAFISYSIEAGEAAHSPSFRGVLTFIKDAQGFPYIPGSSVKGAIRTALAARILKQGNWERSRREIERADYSERPRRYLNRESGNLEQRIFHRLEYRNRNGELVRSAVNDLMQGIRLSDSVPLSPENLILTGKYDRKPDGAVNPLPIFRESLRPGSEARLTMTLDLPMLAKEGLNVRSIEDALHAFSDQHYENFEQYFAVLHDDAQVAAQKGVDLILGGGAGYVSKTITYNLFPQREQALALAGKIMVKQFPPRHGHAKDVKGYKIAPHMLKTAMYKGQYYQMGKCELFFEEDAGRKKGNLK